MGKIKNMLLSLIHFLKLYSITEIIPHKFPVPYQVLPETRKFKLYEMVWWRSEKWWIKSIHCTCYGDCEVCWLELENYPCKCSSHNIQYVNSREVKKIIRCGESNVQSW